MDEITRLRTQLMAARTALAAIAADSREIVDAWIATGCDAGDAIDHVREAGDEAMRAVAGIDASGPPVQTLIKIGTTGMYVAYLNMTPEEALRRFEADTGSPYDPSYQTMETLYVTDSLRAYDLHVESKHNGAAA